MPTVVAIHNAVNERAWQHVLSWEALHECDCPLPKLLRFKGRPSEYSPKARLLNLLVRAPGSLGALMHLHCIQGPWLGYSTALPSTRLKECSGRILDGSCHRPSTQLSLSWSWCTLHSPPGVQEVLTLCPEHTHALC
jgi:hypothetical protein